MIDMVTILSFYFTHAPVGAIFSPCLPFVNHRSCSVVCRKTAKLVGTGNLPRNSAGEEPCTFHKLIQSSIKGDTIEFVAFVYLGIAQIVIVLPLHPSPSRTQMCTLGHFFVS